MRRAVGYRERARLYFQSVEAIAAFHDLDEGIQGHLGELPGLVRGRPENFQFLDPLRPPQADGLP